MGGDTVEGSGEFAGTTVLLLSIKGFKGKIVNRVCVCVWCVCVGGLRGYHAAACVRQGIEV